MILERIERGNDRGRSPRWKIACDGCGKRRIVSYFPEALRRRAALGNRCLSCAVRAQHAMAKEKHAAA